MRSLEIGQIYHVMPISADIGIGVKLMQDEPVYIKDIIDGTVFFLYDGITYSASHSALVFILA